MNASMADSHNLGGYYALSIWGFRSRYLSLEARVRSEGVVSDLTLEDGGLADADAAVGNAEMHLKDDN